MPSDDLLEHAKSSVDFYALLGEGIHPGSPEDAIRRAYRRTALKHHPDKNRGNAEAVDRFHALQIAFDVLSDPAAKAAYDNARFAREAKDRQKQLFEGRRRGMVDDLERRESGAFKRKRHEMDAEEKLEQELRRLAEDGRRRRQEREEALRNEAQKEDKTASSETADSSASKSLDDEKDSRNATAGVPEAQRSIKVRWRKEGIGEDLGKERLTQLCSKFGKVELAIISKDKRMRLGESKKKQAIGNATVMFESVVGSHAAIEDWKKQSGDEWDILESITWLEGKAPDFLPPDAPSVLPAQLEQPPIDTPKKAAPRAFPGLASNPSTPAGGLRKVPSFGSFKTGVTPANSPFGKSIGSPSLEELTMIRLKNAEKRRLEEKIRKEEAGQMES